MEQQTEIATPPTMIQLESSFISEKVFADAELERGKEVHLNDGVWWVKKAPFYYRPLNKMRIIEPRTAKPKFLKAFLGFSYRVESPVGRGYDLNFNMLSGENMKDYDLDKIPSKKRNQVRKGIKSCEVRLVEDITPLLPEMKTINILQAKRFDSMGEFQDYLPADYYETNEELWRKEMIANYSHPAHSFIGAFVDNALAAYIDLIQIEDCWEFGAVKSHDDYFSFQPVDALYFHTLRAASRNPHCKYVINGGGNSERESLTKFKMQFLLNPTTIHNYTYSFVSGKAVSNIKELIKKAKRSFR